jgi:hypothetical protein
VIVAWEKTGERGLGRGVLFLLLNSGTSFLLDYSVGPHGVGGAHSMIVCLYVCDGSVYGMEIGRMSEGWIL